jgi:outer membrane protein, multidrug efflux system
VVGRNVASERRALEFVSSRHDMGVASGLDLAQQQSQLDTTITQIDLLRVQRAQFEHAIARLVGAPAPSFAIEPAILQLAAPEIPIGVPSDVLQRRPDVASAERAMAAANAQIGVAKAAYFPSVPLNAVYGTESSIAADLFSAGSNLWSLGIAATAPIFDAGRIRANTEIARSGYRAAVASYRDTVLGAMQEVQDGLSGSTNLARAAAESLAAVNSAQRIVDIANDRYTGGLATYLDVVTAQQSLLANQRQQVQINGQQMLVAVYLVKALGGDWQSAQAAISLR